jgi:polyhydroxyalkanoate synthase
MADTKTASSGKSGATRTTVRATRSKSGIAIENPAAKTASNAKAKPEAKANAAATAPRSAAPPAPQPAPPPTSTTPKPAPAEPPVPLAEMVKQQTAESWQTLSRNLAEAITRTNNSFATAFHDQSQTRMPNRVDPFDVQGTLSQAWAKVGENPENLREAHADLWKRYATIYEDFTWRMMLGGGPDSTPSAEAPRDKRFRDPEWRDNPAFALMRETYLATSQWIVGLVESADGLDEATKRKAAFFVKQAVDAASPSNFLLTNPAALRETIKSHGENLLRGSQMLSEDLKRGHGMLAIRQTDYSAFEVGKNIATTPGKVVFRNRLIELIQYTPTTPKTFDVPLLIFPPWINKFYIMDLQPKNSLIRWLVSQGHTVFVAAWVNPDSELAALGFEDYMREGVLAAVDAVQEAIDVPAMNTVGYCIGGTLLSATLAYMAAKKDKRIQSATFFAAQTDFEKAGELLVFSDDPGIRYVRERIECKGGFLDAQAMADTFNALRANDLIWNYIVENYYMGKDPAPFDLLYWNSDQTRMPQALHLFYLNKMYKENALAKGQLTLLGERIDLGKVKIPIYMQAAKEDHIAPFASVYRGAKLFGGDVRFLLAGSGHIAGVINHPDAKKYQHWVKEDLADTAEAWLEGAEERPGSWWPNWHDWMAKISGKQVDARTPGAGGLPALADAPGTYVKIRSAD